MNWRSPHDKPRKANRKRNALLAAISFSFIAFFLQVFGAWYTGSLALLGDTAHLFTDLVSLFMSLTAVLLAERPTNKIQSFGLYRLEVLAAFLNGVLLLVVAFMLGYESVERLFHPQEVLALPLLAVSFGGLLLNVFSALVLAAALKGEDAHAHHGHNHGPTTFVPVEAKAGCGHDHGHSHSHDNHDRNLSSAFLHVISDAVSSVAVMAGAAAVYFTGRSAFDSAIGLLLSIVILYWAYRLLHDTVHVLLEGTPRHIKPEAVVEKVRALDSRILLIEDLHVWEITSRMYAATAEVKVKTMSLSEADELRVRIGTTLHESFGIAHAVLAIRPE
ncbi:MAG: cation diffusion facilitator family transporter [Bacteriovoracia bacterium]